MKLVVSFVVVAIYLVVLCSCGSADEWKGRTIYQLLTDRFAQTTDTTSQCANITGYCGGTWQGIINHLDYIQGMGFDAIWISPFVANTEGGFHGYWLKNLYAVNPHFGTEDDLVALVKACHQRNIWVMADVVANHVGPVGTDYSNIVPFNSPDHYHNCNGCPSACTISDFEDLPQVQQCRLAALPDLNQTNPFVLKTFVQWITNATNYYGFDGLRIDTVPEVDPTFWTAFQQAAGVYAVGEVYDGRIPFVASYQGPLDGLLSYPMFFTLRNCFESQQSLYNLQDTFQQYQNAFTDPDLLGTFIDNHDQARFLNGQKDYKLYQNAITYVLLGQGIPIIYYGTEQGFNGANDPYNREVLWPSAYSSSNSLYDFIQVINGYRQKAQPWSNPQVQRYADDSFYAFTRGDTFVALTNGGSSQSQISRQITYQSYSDGTKLCNLFYPTTDTLTVQNGSFTVFLDDGESKVYYPC